VWLWKELLSCDLSIEKRLVRRKRIESSRPPIELCQSLYIKRRKNGLVFIKVVSCYLPTSWITFVWTLLRNDSLLAEISMTVIFVPLLFIAQRLIREKHTTVKQINGFGPHFKDVFFWFLYQIVIPRWEARWKKMLTERFFFNNRSWYKCMVGLGSIFVYI